MHPSNNRVLTELALNDSEQTYEYVSSTEQKVGREEGDPIEGERPHTLWVADQVKHPDQHTTQAEIHRSAVHDDPVVALQ